MQFLKLKKKNPKPFYFRQMLDPDKEKEKVVKWIQCLVQGRVYLDFDSGSVPLTSCVTMAKLFNLCEY